MQQLDINTIMRRFDQFVEASLTKKTQKQIPQPPSNQFEAYFQNMEKRLKIKTITQDQKFQKILAPMKKLKSFVDIKDFLKGLNNKPQKKMSGFQEISQQTKRKFQYQNLRGGIYMEKIQNHLKRKNLKRKIDSQAELLLKQLQQNHSDRNDYGQWMENVLSKINMKEETFLKVTECKQQCAIKKIASQKMMIFEDLTNRKTESLKSSRIQNIKNRRNQQNEQKNFKKVSDFLTDRLKKILTDKYVNNSSKGTKKGQQFMNDYSNTEQFYDDCKMITQPVTRRLVCRTSGSSRKENKRNLRSRPQSIELRERKFGEDLWRSELTSKMQDLMNTTNNFYFRCKQERKQYRNITNPFDQFNKDNKNSI